MIDQPRVLVCSTLDEDALPGSRRAQADCGHLVWVSRSGSQAQLNGVVTKLMCVECALRIGNVGEVQSVPGALEELIDFMGPDMAKAVHHVGLRHAEKITRRRPGAN